jgi:hypothetical protein
MPEIRLVDSVQNEIGKSDRVDQILLFAPVKGAPLQGLDLLARCRGAEPVAHELVALRQETSGSAGRVVDRLADGWCDRANHGPDDFARREELAAVVALLAHLEEESLVDLREGKDVCGIDGLGADLVDLVEDVEKVPLRIDPGSLDPDHDFADDLLPGRRTRLVSQLAKMW